MPPVSSRRGIKGGEINKKAKKAAAKNPPKKKKTQKAEKYQKNQKKLTFSPGSYEPQFEKARKRSYDRQRIPGWLSRASALGDRKRV